MTRCPVPSCSAEVPGQGGVFCPDHHFLIPRRYTSLIFRTQFACRRADDEDTRQHLQEQLAAYIRVAVQQLPKDSSANA